MDRGRSKCLAVCQRCGGGGGGGGGQALLLLSSHARMKDGMKDG